jgi:hypothetical protein
MAEVVDKSRTQTLTFADSRSSGVRGSRWRSLRSRTSF